MKWQIKVIETLCGSQEAIAPEIISASRSTDIPAFYADWFMKRLAAGYVRWVNPFNRKSQFVCFQNTRAIVFWSKNPEPMLKHLPSLDNRNLTYYFQFTVNDYEQERFEPNVPCLCQRIDTFKKLSENIGKERVIWRFDPLLLTETLTVDKLLLKVRKVGDELHKYTEKLVISFADICSYAKVQRNLKKEQVAFRDFTPDAMRAIALDIAAMCKQWGIQAASCGEAISLESYGIKHNRCVDDDLLVRIAPHDKKLMSFLGHCQGPQQGLFDTKEPSCKNLKDKGQRAECGCIVSKDIGQYDTCGHLCVYCYANTSALVVMKNLKNVNMDGDSILCY